MKTKTIRNIAFTIMAVVLLAIAFEFATIKEVTNQTAVVVVRSFASPENEDDSIYMIVLLRDHDVWKTRVNRERFYELEIGDRVLLTRKVGRLSGITYSTSLSTDNYLTRARQMQ